MKHHIKTFLLHGMTGMGFGPLVVSIIYYSLYSAGIVETLTIPEAVKAILSVSAMAFIAAGLPVLYSIEQLPLPSAILLHAVGLYLDYLIMYLVNDWIVKDFTAIGIFTVIFAAGFALIWLIIYLVNRRNARMLNQKLH